MFDRLVEGVLGDEQIETNPILSVIIPTMNRYGYAISAIESVLSIPAPNLELIVQDSSDSEDLEAWVTSNIHDKRLHFYYSTPPVSITENFNKAMQKATGEYVCVIGDDDGINPEIVAAAGWAKQNGLDALTPYQSVGYCWPDFRSWYYGSGHAGKLYINSFSGALSFPDVEAEMVNCVINAGQGTFGLPKVYTGLIKRQCMVEVYKQTGAYFRGISPDVYGALAVANYAKKVCFVDYPLIVPGSSGASNAGRSAMRQHKGKLWDDPHMKPFQDSISWPKIIPEFFSVQTVWAEAAIEALEATRRNDLKRLFNLPLLHALCLASHPDYFRIIMCSFYRALRLTGQSFVLGTVKFIFALFAVLGKRLMHIGFRLMHPKPQGDALEICGKNNIMEGVQALSKYLASEGKTFDQCVRRNPLDIHTIASL